MLGISKRIETLGTNLAKRFHERSAYYFETANRQPTSDDGTRRNMMLVAAIMAEIGTIIAEVTKRESNDGEN